MSKTYVWTEVGRTERGYTESKRAIRRSRHNAVKDAENAPRSEAMHRHVWDSESEVRSTLALVRGWHGKTVEEVLTALSKLPTEEKRNAMRTYNGVVSGGRWGTYFRVEVKDGRFVYTPRQKRRYLRPVFLGEGVHDVVTPVGTYRITVQKRLEADTPAGWPAVFGPPPKGLDLERFCVVAKKLLPTGS